jgi:hypothetical protein
MDDDVESNLTPPNTSTFSFLFCCKICVCLVVGFVAVLQI